VQITGAKGETSRGATRRCDAVSAAWPTHRRGWDPTTSLATPRIGQPCRSARVWASGCDGLGFGERRRACAQHFPDLRRSARARPGIVDRGVGHRRKAQDLDRLPGLAAAEAEVDADHSGLLPPGWAPWPGRLYVSASGHLAARSARLPPAAKRGAAHA